MLIWGFETSFEKNSYGQEKMQVYQEFNLGFSIN